MIPIDHGFLISRGKLINSPYPQLRRVAKLLFTQAGDPLQPTSTATTVRLREGKTLVTDGPFAETKEQLGGYYLVDAKDLDAALAMAARIPGAKTGSVEVRPVMVYD